MTRADHVIAIDPFGLSATDPEALAEVGIGPEIVAEAVIALIADAEL